MKNKLLLLSLTSLTLLSSCSGGSAAHDTFFRASYLENLNLFNMPTLEVTNTRLLDNTEFYYTTTEVDFEKYSQDVFKYLIERESMKYVLYKGEKKTDLLDDKYNRFNVYSSKDINDFKTENGYYFIFSYSELNSDTSLQMAFSIELEYLGDTLLTHDRLETNFNYNAIMSIEGIDTPQYYYYTLKE